MAIHLDASGKALWQVPNDLFVEAPCSFKKALFSSARANIVAVDTTTGAKLWERDVEPFATLCQFTTAVNRAFSAAAE